MKTSEQVMQRYNEMFRIGKTPWVRKEIPSIVKTFTVLVTKESKKPKLLDLGCGNGWLSFYFDSKGIEVEGIDSSHEAIRQANQKKERDNLLDTHFRQGDALNFPYKNGSFDAVFDRGMFHHQLESSWQKYRKGLLKVLKEDGLFYLGVFSDNSSKHGFLPKKIGRYWHKAKDSRGYLLYDHFFNEKLLKGIFGKHFKLLELEEDVKSSKDGSLLLNCIFKRNKIG